MAAKVQENIALFSAEEAAFAKRLAADDDLGQGHLFERWPGAGEKDEEKKALVRQAMALDAQYPGGLAKYVENARKLLQASRDGINP